MAHITLEPYRAWDWYALAINIAIGLAIPIAGLLACEFVLRRWGRKVKG